MGVAVEDRTDAIAVDGFLETARPEIREDFRRFAFDGRAHRRVVHERDARLRAEPGERAFELERFVNGLLHERLDRVLAPRPERAAPEAAGKTLHAGKADPVHLGRLAIEDRYAGADQDLA